MASFFLILKIADRPTAGNFEIVLSGQIRMGCVKIGKTTKIVAASRKINDSMPKKCVKDSLKLLKNNKIRIRGAKIAVLGLRVFSFMPFSGSIDTFTSARI